MPKLFISYSRVDTEFTERVVERLRRIYGLPNVWYDDELYGGVIWWKAILEQIAEADVFIYLLSNESLTSMYCQAEFVEAKRLQKPIITVQVRDRTRLSDELSEIQYVDMKHGMNDDNLARLVRAVNEQASLPKKKRAIWTPATPIPSILTGESSTPVTRPEVETPTLTLPTMDSAQSVQTGFAMRPFFMLGIYFASMVAAGLSAANVLVSNRSLTTAQLLVGITGLLLAFFIWLLDYQGDSARTTPVISFVYFVGLVGFGFLLMVFSVVYVLTSGDQVIDSVKIAVGFVGLFVTLGMLVAPSVKGRQTNLS